MKTKTILAHVLNLAILPALLFLIPGISSCKKAEPPQKRQAVNPYSTESVFADIKKRVDENPRDSDAWYHLADLYERNGQYQEETEALKKVVELKPNMGYAYIKMGNAYSRLNQPREAASALEKAVSLLPDNAVAYNNLGIAYGKTGNRQKEIQALRKALAIRPSYATARYNLGMAYLATGHAAEAKREYEKLKTIDQGLAEHLLEKMKK